MKAYDATGQRHILAGDPDIAAPHPALADEPRGDELDGGRRDREADALRHADDRRVDADHLARRGDQRPAGIAGVECRVGLNDAVGEPAGPRAQRGAQRAYDTRRDGALEAERVADRDNELADPQPARITDPGENRGLAVEPQHRKVGVGIVTDPIRGEGASVGKGRLDLTGAADDMAV